MKAKMISVGETQSTFEWIETEEHERYFVGLLEKLDGVILYCVFGDETDMEDGHPLAVARTEEWAKRIADSLNETTAKLVATAQEE